jgi:hypothetical protein
VAVRGPRVGGSGCLSAGCLHPASGNRHAGMPPKEPESEDAKQLFALASKAKQAGVWLHSMCRCVSAHACRGTGHARRRAHSVPVCKEAGGTPAGMHARVRMRTYTCDNPAFQELEAALGYYTQALETAHSVELRSGVRASCACACVCSVSPHAHHRA